MRIAEHGQNLILFPDNAFIYSFGYLWDEKKVDFDSDSRKSCLIKTIYAVGAFTDQVDRARWMVTCIFTRKALRIYIGTSLQLVRESKYKSHNGDILCIICKMSLMYYTF